MWRRRPRRRTRATPAEFYAKAGRLRHTARKRDASATPLFLQHQHLVRLDLNRPFEFAGGNQF
ncbi:MAG: hypothetical protein IKZ84_14530, partial [Victivallales bacterium]|nr:hypothetical protein [Victivallales bacterium]